MKFLTTLAILGLIGFAASQTTNGAGQCVQCQYWGGNWCPAATQSTATTAANGVCNSALTSCSTTGATLATNPSLCAPVYSQPTHAIRLTTCPDITADSMNSTKSVQFALNSTSYCWFQLSLGSNTNSSMAVSFTSNTTATNYAILYGNSEFSTNFTNGTALAIGNGYFGSMSVGNMTYTTLKSASVLIWSTGTTSIGLTATVMTIVGSSAVLLKAASVLVAGLALFAF